MRILFLVLDIHYLRNYEPVIRALADRGHEVILGPQRSDEKAGPEVKALAASLLAHSERISLVQMPEDRSSLRFVARQLRLLRDFTRYQQPFYAHAEKCAARVGAMLTPRLRWLSDRPDDRRATEAQHWNRRLARLERAIPVDPAIKAALAAVTPDLVFVTPLIDLGGSQIDFVKAARALGLPTVLGVASWDNLTNKGLIKLTPDLVQVWNEDQRHEAIELHEVPEERIAVTGAQLFDDWFDREPDLSREDFCGKIGLDPARPYFLYTASSIFINRNEVDFVAQWIEALRAADDPRLRSAGVLLRPHPKSGKIAKQWHDPRVAEADNVVIFPQGGRMPISAEDKEDYFHSLRYCAGVVGINTSAMLEAGIVGRRSFTIRLPELEQSQDGMVHFAHLVKHGFIVTSESFEAHIAALAAELDRDQDSAGGPTSGPFCGPGVWARRPRHWSSKRSSKPPARPRGRSPLRWPTVSPPRCCGRS